MKKLSLLVMLVLTATLQSFAQDAPTKVKDAFNKKFPQAKSVQWDKENATEWEAEFEMNGKNYSANFGIDGKWKETEYEISESELPTAVKNTLNKEFKGYDIEGAEVTETPNMKAYEVEIEKGETTMEVVIDENGKVLKKKVKKEEDDEEDEDEKED
jgi:uncharacterized membrane protein YkoI